MNSRHLILAGIVGAVAIAPLGACATNDDSPPPSTEPNLIVQPEDAGIDANASADTGVDADAAPADACADCAYFPETCTGDTLCANGPFGTSDGLDPRTQINLIRGRSATDVWVAGALGGIAHFDGTTWTRSDIGKRESIHALWLPDSGEIAAVSFGEVFTHDMNVPDAGAPSPGGWTPSPAVTFKDNYTTWTHELVSAWSAPGATSMWGVTTNICTSFLCRNGRTSGVWRLRFTPPAHFEVGTAISSDLCGRIDCKSMTAIHGSSANDLWAVGVRGAALHITNAESDTPTVAASNSQTWDALYGVWAASASEAWAVGTGGIVRHWTGHPVLWDAAELPTTNDLNAVAGSSASDVWVVGDAGTVFHYDGTSWSRVKIAGIGNLRPKLTTVWVPSPGHVWIGGQGVVLSLGGKP